MASCEKCWKDSGCKADAYGLIVAERGEHQCTPEQQAGAGAWKCAECGRVTMHMFCHVCMNQECKTNQKEGAR